MTLPRLKPVAVQPARVTLTRKQAAARLELHVAHIDKMVRAHMLTVPISAALVDELAGRPYLEVLDGELTVLRTDAARPADPGHHPKDSRKTIGFSVHHNDAVLEETSLRWWRSDPAKVLANRLFVVTIGTYPVALYDIAGLEDTQVRQGETQPRHHYSGRLLARVTPGMHIVYSEPLSMELRPLAHQIMTSRISITSGGPVGYTTVAQD